MAVQIDRQLIENGTTLAQGLLTAHNRLSHNVLLCSQLEKTMHIRKLSVFLSPTHAHKHCTRAHKYTQVSNHISITIPEAARKMSCSIYHRVALRWKMCI